MQDDSRLRHLEAGPGTSSTFRVPRSTFTWDIANKNNERGALSTSLPPTYKI